MTTRVRKIAEEVSALTEGELGELLSWLAEYELAQSDDWDTELERDSQPGGRLETVLSRVRNDIAARPPEKVGIFIANIDGDR